MVQGYPFSGTIASPDSSPSPLYAVRNEASERQVGLEEGDLDGEV